MQRLEFRDLEIEAFVHATESLEKVERAVRTLAPVAPIERVSLGGHFGQTLVALRARVRDPEQIRQTLARVKTGAGSEIARTAARRVDRDLILHIRFDKQLAAGGVLALDIERAHDIVKLSVRLRAPRLNRAGAISLVQREFGDGVPREEE